jgi:hypothetical protein
MKGSVASTLALTMLLMLPAVVGAQTGDVAGQVRDASGAVMADVSVTIAGPALIEGTRTATTDDNGRFRIPTVSVGTYEVRFTRAGFTPLTRRNIEITSGFTAQIVVELIVAGPSDTLMVTGGLPRIDLQNARVQQIFKGSEIADLPTTRDVGGLLLLVPGLTSDRGICSGGIGCYPTVPAFNAHIAPDDSAGGLRQGRIMVDGMVINGGRLDNEHGTANGLTLDPAAAQEVVFTISGALGESETGGAAINIVPRAGGNQFAGSYFTSYLGRGFFSNNRKTRLTSSANVQPYQYDYDVNGSLGGPIVRNRVWFHGYAGDRGVERYPNGGSVFIYPNLNEGQFAANYAPNRALGPVTTRNEYIKGNARVTFQASPRNKLNLYWDEQSSCAEPCYGTYLVMLSPEAYWSRQTYPNRLTQLSWANPFTDRMLFEAGLTYVSTHEDSSHHREHPSYPSIPRVCEAGTTVGRDHVAMRTPGSGAGLDFFINGGNCRTEAIGSGSINYPFVSPDNRDLNFLGGAALRNHDMYRSRASASYARGAHFAKVGLESLYYSEQSRNAVNDLRLSYHYLTPQTTGGWNAAARTGNCLLAPETDPYACGNMSLYYPDDPRNHTWQRPRPVSFEMNTGVGTLDERVWSTALYAQDQWQLGRFSLGGALRYDHAASRYGRSCIGPDVFVAVQWCSEPADGVSYHDLTPRWSVVWDVLGTGRTAVKWNMGKYLQAAAFEGLYVDDNAARRSINAITRAWDDLNGNRIIDCSLSDPNPHTMPGGDTCGTMLDGTGAPSQPFLAFGRPPSAATNAAIICGRTDGATQLQRDYCAEAGQNLLAGWGKRRSEWQFGLGIQHELLPGLTGEVTYNRRTYGNLTATDTILSGCDYYGPRAAVEDYRTCAERYLNFESELFDFYRFTAPVDPRLPGGGGYIVRGVTNQKAPGALPSGAGAATLIRDDLSYYWHGIDTTFALRTWRGLRVSGGTSTGRAVRDTCFTTIDVPNVRGRDENYGCHNRPQLTTNVRATASYVVPWVDVLVGAVYQYRPGLQLNASLQVPSEAAVWEPGSVHRQGTLFNTLGGVTSVQGQPILQPGDLYGESLQMWDFKLAKNVRFASTRLALGIDVYNLFNVDTALAYVPQYTAFRLADGTWVEDNPNTPTVEVNRWGEVRSIVSPRNLKLTLQFDF